MINILVTGGKGQLASCIKDCASKYSNLNFIFKSSDKLDILNKRSLKSEFQNNEIAYCVNCAAYTAVDMAEKESEHATSINEIGTRNLAEICSEHRTVLIHISTDFVFDGNTLKSYNETDKTNPLGVYGLSKLKGELAVKQFCSEYFILRTSWLYSEHKKNFMKTMIQLSELKDELGIVDDQIGTPTYAKDLAEVIIKIINIKNKDYGLYHYSNEGLASWYDFAIAIFDETKTKIKLLPIKTENYPTPAKRPRFSVLDKSKIKKNLKIEIPYWRHSLKRAILNLNKI